MSNDRVPYACCQELQDDVMSRMRLHPWTERARERAGARTRWTPWTPRRSVARAAWRLLRARLRLSVRGRAGGGSSNEVGLACLLLGGWVSPRTDNRKKTGKRKLLPPRSVAVGLLGPS